MTPSGFGSPEFAYFGNRARPCATSWSIPTVAGIYLMSGESWLCSSPEASPKPIPWWFRSRRRRGPPGLRVGGGRNTPPRGPALFSSSSEGDSECRSHERGTLEHRPGFSARTASDASPKDGSRLPWRENRRIVALAFVGLMPLVLMLHLHTTRNLGVAIWGVALYSSLIWALFFYITFSPTGIHVTRGLLTFAASTVFSISLVALARWVIPFQWVLVWISAPNMGTRWAGHLVGVAAVEELAELFPLDFLLAGPPPPPA